MATELLIERDGDRVDYLCRRSEYGPHILNRVPLLKGEHDEFEAAVFRFTDTSPGKVWARLSAGVFSLQAGISPAEARLLALALSTAADEAEAA